MLFYNTRTTLFSNIYIVVFTDFYQCFVPQLSSVIEIRELKLRTKKLKNCKNELLQF